MYSLYEGKILQTLEMWDFNAYRITIIILFSIMSVLKYRKEDKHSVISLVFIGAIFVIYPGIGSYLIGVVSLIIPFTLLLGILLILTPSLPWRILAGIAFAMLDLIIVLSILAIVGYVRNKGWLPEKVIYPEESKSRRNNFR